MSTNYSSKGNKTFWIIILILAILFGLRQTNIFSNSFVNVLFSWPGILFVVGLFLLGKRKPLDFIILTILAVFFWIPFLKDAYPYALPMIPEHHFYRLYWWIPIGLIAIIMIVKQVLVGSDMPNSEKPSEDSINKHAQNDAQDSMNYETAFNSSTRKITASNFSGGKASVSFGQLILDFNSCTFNKIETPILNLEVSFSDCKIILPKDTEINMNVNNSFAQVKDYRLNNSSIENNRIELKGNVAFGSLSIYD